MRASYRVGLGACLFVLVFSGLSRAQLAVRAELLYTMAGPPIRGGVVLIRDGRIERVGPATSVRIPSGYRVLEAKVVTPGLIDARTVVGLSGIYNVPHDQMQLERSAPIQPELRAIDAYNPEEALVEWVRNLGVTTLHTGHGPGALISGQTMIVKSAGRTVEEALVDSVAAVAATLGRSVGQNFSSPGTRAKAVAMLRAELLKAQEYGRKRRDPDPSKRPARDLRLEVLADVLEGKIPLLITAQTAPDILAALRLQREFGFKLVLDGAAEAYLVLEEIKQAGVPVILHPTMVRTAGETRNASMETAALLHRAGIPFALQSGYESYVPKTRVVLFEAAVAAAHGLPFEAALGAITIQAARILGIDRRVGSLEPGKDADMVLFDGDPFEYTTRVCGVIINGRLLTEGCR
ncbi:MAG: amidohydrolase family protein [Bacteroidetes bacterium]|nr:amidohydrolase family protein [Rhodothermia bacterium]MCS7155340.1 amidohydrolase family protein [Bacteroidota bacterium]MCX7907567.1 amidohydrolase family protein [Bacteroidota bacterium]MDW8138561.1 amidohydrolase family protein [Bacteroidota bacterium]MDW8284502.1 amidohydrolase family protein [Bacteroidota bacterium]